MDNLLKTHMKDKFSQMRITIDDKALMYELQISVISYLLKRSAYIYYYSNLEEALYKMLKE